MKIKNLHLILIVFIAFNFQATQISQAQVGFSPATNFATGMNPNSVICADFNGDNKVDLAVANYYTANVSVLLGDGTGYFASATDFAVGTNPNSIISCDFNVDSKADLAVVNNGSNTMSILLGDGLGGFSTANNFVVGNFPYSITNADFNSDGNLDLAVANYSSNDISVMFGNGLGGFGVATNIAVDGIQPCSIASADLNGDGKTDLITANQSSNNLSILLGNGLGVFVANSNFSVGFSPISFICDDFNEDGKTDLAVVGYSSNVSVLLGNGLGNFPLTDSFAIGNQQNSIISADFNGDGKVDLATANGNSNNISVLLGDGVGGYSLPTDFVVGNYPTWIISSDFNGDSKPDIATANYYSHNVSILLNNPLVAIPPTPRICLVTVDSTLTHNVIVWEKTYLDLTAIDSFIVYREITTNNYQRIGAVSKGSMSTFDDFSANPASTAYRYKLKTKNSHGISSPLGAYHNTMYLTNAGANFSWTPYQIENNSTPVSNYTIHRDDYSTGNFQSIGSTTGNQFGFTDVNYDSYSNASYFVEAVMAEGVCNPARSGFTTARSNVKYMGSINIYPNPTGNTLNISGITGKTTLFLYDIVGKLIMEKEVENNGIISISQLEEGIYTLLSETKAGREFNKVVISR